MVLNSDKINKGDLKVLKSFFSNVEDDTKFLELVEKWRSTDWINDNNNISEFANRTKARLEKLRDLGLVQKKESSHNSLTYFLWYPTTIGLYVMLTSIDSKSQRKKFIYANREIAHFGLILKYFQSSGIKRVEILIEEIKDCIKKMKYKKIIEVIKEFFDEIELSHIDWNSEILPESRMQKYNDKTGTNEIF